MHLENLKLTNFKSYTSLDVDLCPNVNCFVGNNGVGKTNLLDAVYYLSFCKSYFNPIDTQNIRHGESYFAIHGRYQDDMSVSCVLKRVGGKQMKCNKKVYRSMAEHIGKIPLVVVAPNDQSIITEGSEVRRKFVDSILSQTDKSYLQNLLHYQKALEQRNRLLKQFYNDGVFDEATLDIWDMQLVRYGMPLVKGRLALLQDFRPLFEKYYKMVVPNGEQPSITYQTELSDSEEQYAQQLHNAHQRDKYALHTTIGPHKDDLGLDIGNYSVKRYGSQGQQKTFVLSLKLAQFEYLYQHCGTKPILLLDDIFDKLDMPRVRQLVHLVGSDCFGQVFLTDTQIGRVEDIFKELNDVEHKIFKL